MKESGGWRQERRSGRGLDEQQSRATYATKDETLPLNVVGQIYVGFINTRLNGNLPVEVRVPERKITSLHILVPCSGRDIPSTPLLRVVPASAFQPSITLPNAGDIFPSTRVSTHEYGVNGKSITSYRVWLLTQNALGS